MFFKITATRVEFLSHIGIYTFTWENDCLTLPDTKLTTPSKILIRGNVFYMVKTPKNANEPNCLFCCSIERRK